MSLADNSLLPPEETYQRQMTSYRRTRSAIMDSARNCLQTQGYAATSMIEIADTAEVSRATLYNHFRDKTSVFRAFAVHELEKICGVAKSADSLYQSLETLGAYISTNEVLATLRRTDPVLVTLILAAQTEPVWERFRFELAEIFGERAGLVLTWLIGQALAPLSPADMNVQIAQVLAPHA